MPPSEAPLVVNLLRQKLFHSGVSEAGLAEEVGIGKAYMANLVAGRSLPSLALALRIAQYLSVNVEDVWYLAPEEGRLLLDVLREDALPD